VSARPGVAEIFEIGRKFTDFGRIFRSAAVGFATRVGCHSWHRFRFGGAINGTLRHGVLIEPPGLRNETFSSREQLFDNRIAVV
jgi:hypothetical protein